MKKLPISVQVGYLLPIAPVVLADGPSTSVIVGLSQVTGKVGTLKSTYRLDSKKKPWGFSGIITFAYNKKCGDFIFSPEILLGYDSARFDIHTTDISDNNRQDLTRYVPGLTGGVGMRVGYMLSPTLTGFIRLAMEYTQGTLEWISTLDPAKYSAAGWNLSPGLALEGKINDNFAWTISANYRFEIFQNDRGYNSLVKNLASWSTKIGLTYYF